MNHYNEVQEKLHEINKSNNELQTTEEELRAATETQTVLNDHLNEQLDVVLKQNAQLQNVQELTEIGYWSYNLKKDVEWSTEMFKMFSRPYQPEPLSIDEIRESLHPEDLEKTKQAYAQTVQTGKTTLYYRMYDSQKHIKYLYSILRCRYDGNNEPIEIFGVSQDVTRQIAEKQELEMFSSSLKELISFASGSGSAQERIANVLLSALEFLDMDTAIVSNISGNDYAVESWASRNKEVALQVGDKFAFSETYCDITYKQDDILVIGEMKTSPHRHHPCYKVFGMEAYIGIKRESAGKPVGTLSFTSANKLDKNLTLFQQEYIELLARIITYELERGERVELLRQANEQQENLLHIVAHDLRGPLNRLYGLLQLMVIMEMKKEEKAEIGEKAKEELEQGTHLVEELLSLYRPDGATGAAEKVDVSAVLQSVAEKAADRAKNLNIQFHTSIIPFVTAQGHKNRLIRAVDNLLSNALKFTPKKGDVYLSLHQDESRFYINITDTGIGMPKEVQQHLFERFSQKIRRPGLNGEKTNGLGMSIVKEIAEQHGGNISVSSTEGKGTSITLKLPLQIEKVEAVKEALT